MMNLIYFAISILMGVLSFFIIQKAWSRWLPVWGIALGAVAVCFLWPVVLLCVLICALRARSSE